MASTSGKCMMNECNVNCGGASGNQEFVDTIGFRIMLVLQQISNKSSAVDITTRLAEMLQVPSSFIAEYVRKFLVESAMDGILIRITCDGLYTCVIMEDVTEFNLLSLLAYARINLRSFQQLEDAVKIYHYNELLAAEEQRNLCQLQGALKADNGSEERCKKKKLRNEVARFKCGAQQLALYKAQKRRERQAHQQQSNSYHGDRNVDEPYRQRLADRRLMKHEQRRAAQRIVRRVIRQPFIE